MTNEQLHDLKTAIKQERDRPPPEAEAMVRRVIETERKARPGIDDDALAGTVQERVREMLDAGDPVHAALSGQMLDEFLANRARVVIALMGARWHPSPPVVPRPARIDAIASTVLNLSGSAGVEDDAVQSIYRWLFWDEALCVHEMELRVEAGKHIVANP